jgi:hypothetical protein
VISSVNDNIRRGESFCYYEIVRGGMREDAKAFVDRKDHEWNGIDTSGMPSYLLGGDYVKTFNDDKLNRDVEIQVTIDRPAVLFVLHDKRSPVPDWLRDAFFDTGDEIGIDGGGYTRLTERKTVGVGPGVSIDDTLSIWRRDVPVPGTVTLGAVPMGGEKHNMYGIVAVPMEFKRSGKDLPGSAIHPISEATPIVRGSDGKASVDGIIESQDDKDCFRFDWSGGVAQVELKSSEFATLDPRVSVYNSKEVLVGYARSEHTHGNRGSVRMNLPAGTYYALVGGKGELGEVGPYHLAIGPGTDDAPAPLDPSPTLKLKANYSSGGIQYSWDAVAGASSYTLERSRNGVNYTQITRTKNLSATDTTTQPAGIYFYRLLANAPQGQVASAPLQVNARPSAVLRLQAIGRGQNLIILDWNEVKGDEGYRVERSIDGNQFVAVATAARNSCGFRDSAVEPGRSYVYRITTLDGHGDAATSEPTMALSGVGDLAALPGPEGGIALSWRADYPNAQLFVERAVAQGGFITIASLKGDAREYFDKNADAKVQNRYRIVSVVDNHDLHEEQSGDMETLRLPTWIDDYCALQFTAKLRVKKAGKYTFNLTSDDGSRLFLDGSLLVDNDGRHTTQEVVGVTGMVAGTHDLEIQYLQSGGKSVLDLVWSGPGFSKQEIEASALSSLHYRYYKGKWGRLPFKKTTAISRVIAVPVAEPAEVPSVKTQTLLRRGYESNRVVTFVNY